MKRLMLLLIPLGVLAMSGCVVAPYGYHRGWYGPRVAVVAPAPVVVIRPDARVLRGRHWGCAADRVGRTQPRVYNPWDGSPPIPHPECVHPAS